MASKGARHRWKGTGGEREENSGKHKKENRGPEQKAESACTKAGQVWAPEGATAFKCLISARFCAALLSNISDCDETFNYWEPTHYLVYGKGFQTWEYSPAYAVRSYAYLWLHALPAWFHANVLQTNKVLVFYFIRCFLAFCSCVCELYFYKAVCKRFGLHVGRLMLAFLVLSTGMFCSAAAYLPSSFCMYTTLIAMTGWYMEKVSVAVLGVAAGAFWGWPFSVVLGVPIAFDFLFLKHKLKSFINWCLVAIILLLVPLVTIDSYYYGKLVIAPLNIVLYNVFTPHGPDLYGTEPWPFYFINGFLNFNVVFIMALLALPLTWLMEHLLQKINSRGSPNIFLERTSAVLAFCHQSSSIGSGFAQFGQPLPYCSQFLRGPRLLLDVLDKCYHFLFQRYRLEHYTVSSNWLAIGTVLLFALLSFSRSIALFRGYHAPLDLYPEFYRIAKDPAIHTVPESKTVNVCVGKEWYRFPSNFFFFPKSDWQLQFIESEFRGQLPKPYGKGRRATSTHPKDMNDQNLEETSRYVMLQEHFQFVALPFGLATAPRVFTKIMAALMAILRVRSLVLFPYLDDLLIKAPCFSQAHESLSIVLDTLVRFGWRVNRKKSCLIPSRRIIFLGMRFDTRQTKIFPKTRSIHRRDIRVLQGPRSPSFRSAMKVLGKMLATLEAIPFAQFHSRPLQQAILSQWNRSIFSLDRPIRLSPQAKQSLNWWLTSPLVSQGRSFLPVPWQVDIAKCHYLVDLDTATKTAREPRYSAKEEWTVIAYKPFLDASRSSKLLRAFFIPFVSSWHTTYSNYTILKARRPKQIKKKNLG
ncbi:unnamed protein product [Ranitomeya imitator]|uniref:Mannosyltransferase n=1 Tax=Ranitomeya imitator TaxID=111125 RepID=A0ABN9M0W2_9NEOB|nr:unnamed protein product [Ranitomeya imitator]